MIIMRSKRRKLVSKWNVGGRTLELRNVKGSWKLVQQTADWDLLTSLAKLGFAEVARCALDIVFQYGFTTDTTDALRAYSECPLKSPPKEYLELCYAVDWTRDYQTSQLYAIVLAGSSKESDKKLLCQALSNSKPDMRDGALYAAGTFNDAKVIERVVTIATARDWCSADATGERDAIGLCFRRWMDRDILREQDLEAKLRTRDPTAPRYICTKQWLNHLVCANWRSLPYLDATLLD